LAVRARALARRKIVEGGTQGAANWRRRAARVLALAATLSLFAVRDRAPLANGAELEFEYTGCARVRPGPVCELTPERELSVWVAGALRPDIAGASANVKESLAVEGGWRVTFQVPEGISLVRLRLGQRDASLVVAKSSEPPEVRELTRWWKEGQWEQVRARLDQGSNALAATERAAAELEATAESAERAGLLLEASNDRFAAIYCRAIRLRQYARATGLLESMPIELLRVPEIRARRAYYSGVIAEARGDVQGALVQFRTASVLSRRLGLVSDELLARQELAVTLSQLHRDAEALAEQQALVARAAQGPSCQLALSWENLSWMLLTQAEPVTEGRTAAALDRAEELLQRCPDPLSRRNQALNRVAYALQRRDGADAEARLRALDADETGRSGRLATWQALYWGELHLLRAESAAAQKAYDLAERLAESLALKDCVYLARLGRARALAPRRDQATVDSYLAAEEAADALVRWAPFGQGQQLTALRVQSSARELLTLLLGLGRSREALQTAQRATHRMWTSNFRASRIANLSPSSRQRWDRAVTEYRERRQDLERVAHDDWKLSFEGLGALRLTRALERQRLESALAAAYAVLSNEATSTPEQAAQGDAELLIAAGSDAWWAFFSRQGALRVELVSGSASRDVTQAPALESGEVARGLAQVLERFERDGLLAAPLLRVTLPPELQTLDVHALPVTGRALIEWMPVGYAFEPGATSDTRQRDTGTQAALVFGDPNADLPRANAEARRVARRLADARLLLGDQVTFEAVASQLANARLLHFAGHARSGGIDGLTGALALSHGQRLSVADVLACERVPEFVVLSACASSVSPEAGGGLSIGQAFLVAGSQAVVGASRAISDDLAGRFTDALYDRLLSGGSSPELPRDIHAWAAAVRAAGLEQRRADPRADWASIRLLLR
jgi:hypothetical protein